MMKAKLACGVSFTNRRQNFKSKMKREVRAGCFLGKKNLCDREPRERISCRTSHVEVRNCRAARNTELIHIWRPNILCMSSSEIRPFFLTDTMNLSNKLKIFRLCFKVIEIILCFRSIVNPRCRVDVHGGCLLSLFSSIPKYSAHYSATKIWSMFRSAVSARNQISSR